MRAEKFVIEQYETYEKQRSPGPALRAREASADKGHPHPGSLIDIPFSGKIHMQYGEPPTKIRNGALMTEVIDALVGHLCVYQTPGNPMASRETACAITKLQEARMWLSERQRDRARRGVRFEDRS